MKNFTKYFCPQCKRFKYSWQTTEGWGGAIHCRHCGHEIIEVTKEFIEQLVMNELNSESEE